MPGTEGNNWFVRAPGALERMEAHCTGVAFAPHRHDTYAIGITLSGVQAFTYRGAVRRSLAGHIVVLHPDELHDGRAGTDCAFQYRVLYLDPARLQQILGGCALPFLEGGVSTDQRLKRALWPLLADHSHPLDPLACEEGLAELALALCAVAGCRPRNARVDYDTARLVRSYLESHIDDDVTLADLERIAGHDRWSLSRDFREAFGTSPYRYLTLRRLDQARALIAAGCPISETAAACGFADQSHLTRHYKKTFGMTPKVWASAVRTNPRCAQSFYIEV